MEQVTPWEELKRSLLEEGYGLDKIDKLESLLRKDELLHLLETVLTKLRKLEETAASVEREIPSAGEGVMNKANLIEQSVKRIVTSLMEDQTYMRPFLRNKSKIKEVRNVLEVTIGEISSIEKELLDKVNSYVKEMGIEIKAIERYEEITAFLNILRALKKLEQEGKPTEAEAEVLEEKPEEVKKAEIVKKKVEEALETLKNSFYSLRSIDEELDLMGVRYRKLSHVLELEYKLIEKASQLDEDSVPKYVQRIVSKLAQLENESKKLIEIAQKIIDLKASVEEMKGDLLERIENINELSALKEVIPYVGMDFPRVPLVVWSKAHIDLLRKEAERIDKINMLFKNIINEIEYLPKDVKIDLSKLSFETTESFLNSLSNLLRAARLSYGMPEISIAYTGVMSEILELYPKWREKIISILREKGEIDLRELKFVPSSWRPWVLKNLSEEGLITVKEDRVMLRTVSEDVRKLEMELEMIEDMVSDLGDMIAGVDLMELKRMREDLEKARSLLSAGKTSEYRELISSLRSRVGKMKMQLGVKR